MNCGQVLKFDIQSYRVHVLQTIYIPPWLLLSGDMQLFLFNRTYLHRKSILWLGFFYCKSVDRHFHSLICSLFWKINHTCFIDLLHYEYMIINENTAIIQYSITYYLDCWHFDDSLAPCKSKENHSNSII